jgi:hypothetical protein
MISLTTSEVQIMFSKTSKWVSAMLVVFGIVYVPQVANATITVTVPDYPSVSELEAGWNTAFTTFLADEYGGSPSITSTTTYEGPGGGIYVVSEFVVGSEEGSILAVAFSPETAQDLGNGKYLMNVEDDWGFECYQSEPFCACSAERIIQSDGTIIQRCNCDGGTGACGMRDSDGAFAGLYELEPSTYSNLPGLQ